MPPRRRRARPAAASGRRPARGPDRFPPLVELESEAARCLPEDIWAYVAGGAGEERTLRANREAFARATVRPSVLRGIAELDLRTTILGTRVAAPVLIPPMAYLGKIHPDAEPGLARAAAGAGLLGIYSTLSTASLEEIAAGGGPRWFQLYHQPEPVVERALLGRVVRAGYSALVLTVDTPLLGVRDRQAQGGFAIDRSLPVGNGPGIVPPARGPEAAGDRYRLRRDAGASWALVDELGRGTGLPVVVKGVLTAEDARQAVEHGARGVIVSNHGGRQLDGAPASLDALPEVVRAVDGRAEVYLDGGVRRGIDVLVALARGACAVGIGRPILWALAVGGADGVGRYLEALKIEIAVALALTGRRSVAELDASLLAGPD